MVPRLYQSSVRGARDLRVHLWPEVRTTHACLYEAVCLQMILAHSGLGTMLQAGTCQWPMIRPEEDDGERATHFTYRWDPQEALPYIIRAALPELHVWLGFRSEESPEGVIVDTTSGSWPARARVGGYPWSALEPPECLWATPSDLGALEAERGFGITYAASLDACGVADGFARHGIYPVVAKALGIPWP